jgi:hypothetical protein
MLSRDELYSAVLGWVHALEMAPVGPGATSLASLATALLNGQSLRSAALERAQLSARTVRARQRYKRVARALTRPWLSSAQATPHLVRAALELVDDPVPHLAMDTVRCGAWEAITVGVVWHGRMLPMAWEVLPYPWPKGQFTPTVIRLLQRIGAVWPTARPPHLVADRGFPSLKLFRCLEQLGWGWTIRLRAKLNVGMDGAVHALRDLIQASRAGEWTCRPITYGTGRQRVAGRLVIGRGNALPVLPSHQANPGSLAQRQRQQTLRQREVRGKHPSRRTSLAQQTDGWVVLFTNHTDWLPASQSYTTRWTTEGTYRDAQSGYDGQHGWNLEDAVTRLTDAAHVDRLLGLWALGTLLQTWVGHALTQPSLPHLVRDVQAQWTTSNRLSVWMRGRFAFTDPSADLHPWLLQSLAQGAQRLRDPASQQLPLAA